MARFFFDTEFEDDGKRLQLISIGIVREDGAGLYAEAAEYDRSRAGDWLKANVVPQLQGPVMDRWSLSSSIRHFCGHQPEFWAYYAAHDWVLMCNIFGGMLSLPPTWPHFCYDLKQYEMTMGVESCLKQTTPEHHAMNDARYLRDRWRRSTQLSWRYQ